MHASINAAGAFDPETGHYATIHYAGCPTMDRAKEIKQGLYRAAQRIGVSMATEIVKEKDGTFTVVYKAVNKEHARRWVLQKYGNDPAKWPYDPRGNGKQ